MSEYVPCPSFWVSITSLKMAFFSSSIHLQTNFKISLIFFHWVVLQCINEPHFLYPSSVEEHLGCFQFLDKMNNAAINRVEQMSLWYECVSLDYVPMSGIAGSSGRLVSNFLRNTIMISKVTVHVCTPTRSGGVFPILSILSSLNYHCCFLS